MFYNIRNLTTFKNSVIFVSFSFNSKTKVYSLNVNLSVYSHVILNAILSIFFSVRQLNKIVFLFYYYFFRLFVNRIYFKAIYFKFSHKVLSSILHTIHPPNVCSSLFFKLNSLKRVKNNAYVNKQNSFLRWMIFFIETLTEKQKQINSFNNLNNSSVSFIFLIHNKS